VPILVMDVHRRRDDIRKAFHAGADDYLEMPYDLSVMLRAWRRTCGFRRHPAPLTALQSDDGLVRQIALSVLTEKPFSGVASGLCELLHSPDPNLRAMGKWAMRRVGTAEALALLNESQLVDI
jgi:HEAT repeat protein